MSYAGYLDRKRSKTYATSSGNTCLVTLGTTGPPGQTGPMGEITGQHEGPIGPTGLTGSTGPTGYFGGQVYETIIPSSATLDIGSPSQPFQSGYFSGGIIGGLEVSKTAVIPLTDRTYDLGSVTSRFGSIYTQKLFIDNKTITVLDPSGNTMSMSYDTTNGRVSYSYLDTSGTSNVVYGVQTSVGNPSQIDSAFLPFTSLSYLNMYDPTNHTFDESITQLFSSLSTSILPESIANILSGNYVIVSNAGTVNMDTNHTITVSNTITNKTYTIIQNLDNSANSLPVLSGDIFIATFVDLGDHLTFDVTWSQVAFNITRAGLIYSQNIAPGAVGTANIATNSITNLQIAPNAVTSSQILDGSITTEKIAPNTITGDLIGPGAISATNIQNNTITGTQIANNTLTAANFQLASLTS